MLLAEFAKLIKHSSPDSADIKILDPLNWDSHGKHTDVIEAVREASQGNDVRVYQVTRDATRTEYWVVSHADGKLIGAKALSIESWARTGGHVMIFWAFFLQEIYDLT